LMQNLMCGPHPLDNASIRPKYRIPSDLKAIQGWKIAYSLDLDFFEIDEDVRVNTLQVVDTLRELGAEVEEVAFGWNAAADRAAQNYLDHLFGAYIKSFVDSDPSKASEWAKYCAGTHAKVTAAEFMDAYEVAAQLSHKVGAMLNQYQAFICPTMGSHEIPADHEPDQPVSINGKSVDILYGWCLAHPFNMLGRCPVLSVPSGMAENGVPTGVQLVGRTYDDERVFRAGAALETLRPRFTDESMRPPL